MKGGRSARRGALWRAVRIAGSGLLLGVILWNVDLQRVFDAMSRTDLRLFLVASSFHVGGVAIRALRWRGLLAARGCTVSLGTLSHIILVGNFANNFLPTSFGGDAYRGLAVGKPCGGLSLGMTSVVVDRLLGLLALLGLASLALGIGVGEEVATGPIWIVLAGGGAAILVPIALLRRGRWIRLIQAIPARGLRGRVERFGAALANYGSERRALIVGFLWSVALQAIIILQFYIFALALGLDLSLVVFAVFIPVILVLLMLPISVGGLGVREGLFVVFFSTVAVSAAQALALSLLFFVSGLTMSLYGGYLFMISHGEERRWLIPAPRRGAERAGL